MCSWYQNHNIPVESTAAFNFSRVIYIHLAKSSVYKYYSCCIFDGLYFQRTSSFSGVKGRLDLHLVPLEQFVFKHCPELMRKILKSRFKHGKVICYGNWWYTSVCLCWIISFLGWCPPSWFSVIAEATTNQISQWSETSLLLFSPTPN